MRYLPPILFLTNSNYDVGYEPETFTNDLSLVLSALHSLDPAGLKDGLSPFGVGFIVWTTPIEILDTVFPQNGVIPHPAAIWLFAGAFEEWIPIVHERSPDTIILVQVGSISVLSRSSVIWRFVCWWWLMIGSEEGCGSRC